MFLIDTDIERINPLGGHQQYSPRTTMTTPAARRNITCICLGAPGVGKTLMLRKLQKRAEIDETTSSVPTVGTSLYKIKFQNNKSLIIRELGGLIAPLWPHYYSHVNKIVFVIDVSNLCQISVSGVLFYTILSEPTLKNARILLILSKMDLSYRQMRNEALLMLQIEKLKSQIQQQITIVEFSSITGIGIQNIVTWLETE